MGVASSESLQVAVRWLLVLALWSGPSTAQEVLHEWTGVVQPPLGDQFGTKLTGCGDIDGDGVPDVVVGASFTNVGSIVRAGRVYVFSGRTGTTIHTLSGTEADQWFGIRVESAGDIDLDGRGDFIVHAYRPPYALLYSGRTGSLLRSFGRTYTEAIGAGDVTGDGVPDVLASNPYADVGANRGAGRADLLSGKDWSVLASFPGTFQWQFFGYVRPGGDFDADGVPDLLLGAHGSYTFRTSMGGIWAYSGKTHKLLFRVPPPIGTNSFGWQLTGAGDVDGDGYDDVALHDRGDRVIPRNWDIHVFGGPDGRKIWSRRWPLEDPVGDSLARAGDLDGDGFAEVLTGAAGYRTGGQVLALSGRDRSFVFEIRTAASGTRRVAELADVNGDDFPDFLVGGRYDPARNLFFVRLYSGAPLGVRAFGVGCKDARGVVPRIGATRSPKLGTTFQVNLSRTLPGRAALLLLGTSSTSWGHLALPLDLGFAGLPGCLLRVSPGVLAATATTGPTNPRAKGRATLPFPIPPALGLRGQRIYAQWLVFESARTGSATRALEVTVQ